MEMAFISKKNEEPKGMKKQLFALIGILLLLVVVSEFTIPVKSSPETETCYSLTTDGYIRNDGDDWSTIRNAETGASVDDNDISFGAFTQACYYAADNQWITRSFYYFDTSSINETAEILNVTLYLYGVTYAGSDASAQKGTQADTLTTADYDAFTGNEYGHVSWLLDQYNTISFNAQGKADINKTGITKICVREYTHDYTGTPPVDGETYNGAVYTEQTGTDNDPKLEIIWQVEQATVTFYNNSGGQMAVNGTIITNGTSTDYNLNDVIILTAYPDGSKLFANYTWNGNTSTSNPYNLAIYQNCTLWCYFDNIPEPPPTTNWMMIPLVFGLAAIALVLKHTQNG